MRNAKFIKLNENQNPNIIKHPHKKAIRLNKFIANSGYTSRRGADKLIDQGLVFINNKKSELGQKVYQDDIVSINNKIINHNNKLVYLLINKPVGITSTTDLKDKSNIVTYMNFNIPVFPIGRLDKDSSGLLFMTNDGDLVNKILRVEYGHEKEYIVTVNKELTTKTISQLQKGVKIYNLVAKKYEITLPTKVTKLSPRSFKIILKQGLNRQIRRMTLALGYEVINLQRIRIMNVVDNNLKQGSYRYLTNNELESINKAINKFDYT